MLRQLTFKGVYKSDQDNILEDFYVPALSCAIRYDRAVGYFSASAINHAAQALSAFIGSGGQARLILGAFTDQGDMEAVLAGSQLQRERNALGEALLDELGAAPDDELFQHRYRALAWLVASGNLTIKVALRPKGIFHDKVGVIQDANGDAVVFSGSANESAAALIPSQNYESISVYPTWRNELADYFEPHRQSFARLWANESPGTLTLPVPEAFEQRLLEVARGLEAAPSIERELAIAARLKNQPQTHAIRSRAPALPKTLQGQPFEIRSHQREALSAWKTKGDFQGILALATGAGKTITAAYATVQIAQAVKGLTTIIAVPYQNLADQWCEVLAEFNIHPIRCYETKANWAEELSNRVLALKSGSMDFGAIVVVNRTLQSPQFQAALADIPGDRILWIGDECHHHASNAYAKLLPPTARFRLGLSATPEHYLDGERNQRLADFYGSVVFEYSLREAIETKILTPYEYHPIVVELTAGEAEEFVSLSDEIAKRFATNRKDVAGALAPQLKALLMKRARLVGAAQNKIPALHTLLEGRPSIPHTLFYCGDGRVLDESEDPNDQIEDAARQIEDDARQIEVVSEMLDRLGWNISRFTSRESRRDRSAILNAFKDKAIDGLVAIRCLDEGIDIPACGVAYILASSRDPRQFVQRRGRILRRAPGKEKAVIYDFIVVLPEGAGEGSGAAKKLIEGELRRVAEFARLSLNGAEAYMRLRPLLMRYGLEHAV